jgi:hypothetical protein
MLAVNGFFEDGRFTPVEAMPLPRRFPAMLVFNEADVGKISPKRNNLKSSDTWDEFDKVVKSMSESERPRIEDFPRNSIDRTLIDFGEV